MTHILIHVGVPLLVATVFYRAEWLWAASILLATMVVDADHLLADPIYDPNRCSIGMHPLHTVPAIALYFTLSAFPIVWRPKADTPKLRSAARGVHLIGLGLLIHMALDLGDCFV